MRWSVLLLLVLLAGCSAKPPEPPGPASEVRVWGYDGVVIAGTQLRLEATVNVTDASSPNVTDASIPWGDLATLLYQAELHASRKSVPGIPSPDRYAMFASNLTVADDPTPEGTTRSFRLSSANAEEVTLAGVVEIPPDVSGRIHARLWANRAVDPDLVWRTGSDGLPIPPDPSSPDPPQGWSQEFVFEVVKPGKLVPVKVQANATQWRVEPDDVQLRVGQGLEFTNTGASEICLELFGRPIDGAPRHQLEFTAQLKPEPGLDLERVAPSVRFPVKGTYGIYPCGEDQALLDVVVR